MDPVTIATLASLGIKGLSSLFGGRSKRKQQAETNRATTAGLNIRQKQSEDSRRARLALAQGLMGRIPATTAGGGVRTNQGPLDPALFDQLNQERTYDFGSAMPKSAGGMDAFLEGLFGGAADVIPRVVTGGATSHTGNGMPTPSQPMPHQSAIDLDELRALGKTTSSEA